MDISSGDESWDELDIAVEAAQQDMRQIVREQLKKLEEKHGKFLANMKVHYGVECYVGVCQDDELTIYLCIQVNGTRKREALYTCRFGTRVCGFGDAFAIMTHTFIESGMLALRKRTASSLSWQEDVVKYEQNDPLSKDSDVRRKIDFLASISTRGVFAKENI